MTEYLVLLTTPKGNALVTAFASAALALRAVQNVKEGKMVDGLIWVSAEYLGPSAGN